MDKNEEQSPMEKNLSIELQQRLTSLDDSKSEVDPKKRLPFMSAILACRDELKMAKRENLLVRKAALKELMENDYDVVHSALVNIGIGFIPTQP